METRSGEKRRARVVGEVAFQEEIDEDEILRRRISGHPLYGVLIQTHLDCLKVASGEFGEAGLTTKPNHAACSMPNKDIIHPPSDLDHFMEEYCVALSKLKQGMEEAQQEAASFINSTYLQLEELSKTSHP